MAVIKSLKAREILDSRGNPTVEAKVETSKGIFKASVPSGASTGVHEVIELRDGGRRFHGKGVLKAVNNVNILIAKALRGKNCANQKLIDNTLIKLDGTANKSKLGANAILSASMACCKAGSQGELFEHIGKLFGNKKFILPVPFFNVINGGKHSGGNLDFQEYMVLPDKAKSFSEAMQIGSEVYHRLKQILTKKYGKIAINIGDEGGFAPPLSCYEEPLDLMADAVQDLGYWKKVSFGLDVAATSFYKDDRYLLEGKKITANELAQRYIEIVNSYPVVSIEDPFYEEDFETFALLTRQIGKKVQIVGDDLLCTNPDRIKMALTDKSCNVLLLKINQIGTITEALNAAKLALDNNWKVMVSHRSGETTDSFMADLVVGLGVGQIKAGAPCRGERLAKYNRLLEIEQKLGKKAKYAGRIK